MTLKAVPFARDGSVLEPPTSSKAWRAAKALCALREVGMASRGHAEQGNWGSDGFAIDCIVSSQCGLCGRGVHPPASDV
jgi:hypothetical protein